MKRFHHLPKERMIAIFNRYSLLFHAALSMLLCFTIEVISRHSIFKAFGFVGEHTWAFIYNSFILFASLSLVYLVRRRAFWRVLISGLWLFLGTVNGCILSACIQNRILRSGSPFYPAEHCTCTVPGTV